MPINATDLERQLSEEPAGSTRARLLIDLARQLCFSTPARAIQLAGEAASADNSPDRSVLADSLFLRGRACLQLGQYADSLGYLIQAQPIYEDLQDDQGLMWLYNEVGRLYYFLSDYATALEYYQKTLEMAHRVGNLNRQAASMHNIGLVYTSTGDPVTAREKMLQGLEIARTAQDAWVEAFVLGGLAEASFHLKEFPNALAYGQQSLALARATPLPGLISGILIALSWSHFELGEPEKARHCLDEVLELAGQSGDARGRAEAQRALGEQFNRVGRYLEGRELLGQALDASLILGEKALTGNCHLALIESCKQLGDYPAALAHSEEYHRIDKEIFNERSDLRLRAFQAIHQVEAARREAELVQLRNVTLQQEIEERKNAQKALEHLASYDPLTGLFNRRAFFTQAQPLFAALMARQLPVSVIMLDADYFKRINDQYGHQTGDRALASLAAAIQAVVREGDLVCRYGGEEFVLMLPETDQNDALKAAERLRGSVQDTPLPAGTALIHITISLGVATTGPTGENSLDRLLTLADQALYQAKNSGRNCVCLSGGTD